MYNIVKKFNFFCQSLQKVKLITHVDTFEVFISCNFDGWGLNIMKTQNSVSEMFQIVKKLNREKSWQE